MVHGCIHFVHKDRMLHAIVFDMDGVIIDSHAAHRRAWSKFLHNQGRHVSDGELDDIFDSHKRTDILQHFLGQLSDKQLISYGKQKDELFRQASPSIKPVPGVLKFLRHLKRERISTGVATSASQVRTKATLDGMALSEYFDAIVTGNDILLGKPDPSIYRLCCTRLGIVPKHALAIEDAVSGIQAARSAGLHCIGMISHESSEKLRAAGAEQLIHSFQGLSLDTLERLVSQTPGLGVVQQTESPS